MQSRCKICFGTGRVLKGGKLTECVCKAKKKDPEDALTFETSLRRMGEETRSFKYKIADKKKEPLRSDLMEVLKELKVAMNRVRTVIRASKKPIYRSPYNKG